MSFSVFVPARWPDDERSRQKAVDAADLHHAPPDAQLHDIVRKAARLFGAPMAAVSIIDRDVQLFVARVGIPVRECPRDVSFCGHVIVQPDVPMVVRDTLLDERFADNPLVREEMKVRFYAGVALLSRERQPLGALCVMDHQPHDGALPVPGLVALARQASGALDQIRRDATA